MSEVTEVYQIMREEAKRRRQTNLASADRKGWTLRTEYHWQRDLLGDRIDYWPSRNKWRWRGQTYVGSVAMFIAKKERDEVHES